MEKSKPTFEISNKNDASIAIENGTNSLGKHIGFDSFFLSISALVICLFSGCVVGPDFNQPLPPPLNHRYVESTTNAYDSQQIDLTSWWQVFSDPLLEHLLSRAVSQSPTIQEAYERIAEARAQVQVQGGRLQPSGVAGSDYSFTKRSQNAQPFVGSNGDSFNLFSKSIDASWELDLFGKIQRSIQAAEADLSFQEYELESVRQTLLAEIASSYLRIRLFQRQIASANEALAVQSQTENLVAGRTDAGLSTELDKTQTSAFMHRSIAQRTIFERQLDLEFNLLNRLLGQAPDPQLRHFVGELPLPQIPPIPDVGIPAELLRRRPDIRRDEMAVAATSANIGIATADLYPQLSLLGSISLSAQTVSGLFETEGLGFAVGPSVKWNVFNRRQIGFNIEVQEARFRQATARYQTTVLNAVAEVEETMIQHHGYKKQLTALSEAVVADEKAVALSLERYKAGKANFQRVIDAQTQLLQDRQSRDEAQAQAVDQLIKLYKASGGGWQNHANAGTSSGQVQCGPSQCGPSQCGPSQCGPEPCSTGIPIQNLPQQGPPMPIYPGISVPMMQNEMPGSAGSQSIYQNSGGSDSMETFDFLYPDDGSDFQAPKESPPIPDRNTNEDDQGIVPTPHEEATRARSIPMRPASHTNVPRMDRLDQMGAPMLPTTQPRLPTLSPNRYPLLESIQMEELQQ